jgi:hypothetical protein
VFYETNKGFPPRIVVKMREPAWRKAIDRGMEFAAFDEVQPIEKLVTSLEAISLDAFKGNFLYSPIPGEVFQAMYAPTVRRLDLSLSQLVRAPDGKGSASYTHSKIRAIASSSRSPFFRLGGGCTCRARSCIAA